MNVKIVLISLFFLSVVEVLGTDAKQKSLKIVVPSKIRYVHHHHTHVVLMKDKKLHKERPPDAKFHHLHYYEDRPGNGRKHKGVSHHYYIPYVPPQAEDEAEEETVSKYTVVPPKNLAFHKPNFNTRQPPQEEEEPYQTHQRKYRVYGRNPGVGYTTPRTITEYYEADPYFAMMNPAQEPHASATKISRYNEVFMPHYTEEHEYEGQQLFYPEKSFYDSGQNFPHIY